jgi:hypothetical protein
MSRSEAFSAHDWCTIIHQLAETGNWEGERAGVPARLVRYPTPSGNKIGFALRLNGVWVNV